MTAPVIDASHVPLDAWSAAAWRELLDVPPSRGVDAEFEVELFDSEIKPVGMIVDYSSCRIKFVKNKIGPAQIVIPGSSEFAGQIMKCDSTTVFIRVTYNGRNYDGLVDEAIRKGIKGNKTITVNLVDMQIYLACIMAYPMPLPGFEEVQFPPEDLYVGPLRSGIYWYLQRNVWRLQFRTGQCPITLLPYDILRDTSEWVTMQARMVPLDELFERVLKDSSCMIRMRMWIKGRDPQPMPDRLTLLESQIIVDVVDRPKSGGVLNTGFIVDGLANTISETIADSINGLLGGFLPGLADLISKQLKQTELPSCVWSEDSEGIIDATVTAKAMEAYSVVVGGKSPTWLNKLLQLAIEQGIIALATSVLTFLSIPIGGLGGIIGGVAGALSGILDDVFLAFMKATNYKLKREHGKFARPEKFVNGGAAGYTFSSFQNAQQGLFDNAGKRRAKVEVLDWAPFGAFYDYDLGHLVGWEDEGETFFDRVESIEVNDDRDERVVVRTVIGDDEPEKSPGQKSQERIKRLFSMINAATLATN
ncbi:hypothetical protein CH305_18515 [Rhodococcus sp. 15-649-2-2]|uniref:Gp37-like protein n=1 Tax=Rhodococcus sp. 15-649-2-2 TaxID=2023140 RepID=UPI000B9C0A5D|nr:hypothetical protein [Rhodococcus sp. 15-649-2-2]OZE77230.1 hypothetical protein CH305_18515 [Rhodococcus sp. 15-649-2-2]